MSKISKTKEFFIKLISSVINEREVPVCTNEVDVPLLFKIASRNSSQAMIYYALLNRKSEIDEELFLKLEKSYKATMLREFNQQNELEQLRSDFTNSKIDFMLLKGTHLKQLYPKPEMRFMVDMDVMVKVKDIDRAGEIIRSHGFSQKMNNGKDIVYIKEPFLTIELHNSLFIDEYYMSKSFKDVWEKAEKVTENEYKMSLNNLYVYTMAHLAEHYTSAGACFRPTIDIYLMNKNYSSVLDFDYIDSEFEKLNLLQFAENIKELGFCWFDGHIKNDNLEVMENYIILGPPINNTKVVANAANGDKSKLKMLVFAAFPGMYHMKNLYPILKKAPFLLPVFWLVRIIKHLFMKETKEKLESIKSADLNDVEIIKDIYNKSGISNEKLT